MKALRGKIAVPLVAKARRWQTRILFPPPLCVRWTFKKERDRVEQDAKMTKYRSKKEWNNVKTKHCGKIPGRLLRTRTRTMYKDIGDPEKWELPDRWGGKENRQQFRFSEQPDQLWGGCGVEGGGELLDRWPQKTTYSSVIPLSVSLWRQHSTIGGKKEFRNPSADMTTGQWRGLNPEPRSVVLKEQDSDSRHLNRFSTEAVVVGKHWGRGLTRNRGYQKAAVAA